MLLNRISVIRASARIKLVHCWNGWFSTPSSVIAEAQRCVDQFEQLYGNRNKDYPICVFLCTLSGPGTNLGAPFT
jgi:hypothetical protein